DRGPATSVEAAAARPPAAKFTSKNPLEADTANAIENALPGRVQTVGEIVWRPNGSQLTDYDIVGDDFIIEVTGGVGTGKTSQVQTIAASTTKRVAVYGPKIKPTSHVARGIEAQGVPIFRVWSDLIRWIAETGPK